MKKKLLILAFLISNLVCAQNSTSSKNLTINEANWNSKTILSELFDGENVDSLNTINWLPYNGEFVQKSFDGYCYTTIDSIYAFKKESLNYRIVVLKTNAFSGEDFMELSESEASTMGIALFSEENKDWKLINFNRSAMRTGHGGYLGSIEILDLGNNLLILSLNESEYHDSDLHNYLISLNESDFGVTMFSTRTFHGLIDSNDYLVKFETSEFVITKAETEDSYAKMKLIKKCTTIKDDVESTKVVSTTNLVFDGFGFY